MSLSFLDFIIYSYGVVIYLIEKNDYNLIKLNAKYHETFVFKKYISTKVSLRLVQYNAFLTLYYAVLHIDYAKYILS